MKRNVYWVIAVSILLTYCSPKNDQISQEKPATFTLNADISGLVAKYLIYYEKDDSYEDGYYRDTLWVENGKFSFTDSVSDYQLYYIDVPNAVRTYKVKYGDREYTASTKANVSRLWFIGYPGAEISYTGKMQEYMVDAYPSDPKGINDDLALIHKQIFPLLDKNNALSVEASTGDYSDEEKKALYEKQSELWTQIKKLKYDFISSHPQSIAASWVFKDAYYRKYYSAEEVDFLYNQFDDKVLAGTPFYEETKERIEAARLTAIGSPAPELTTQNTLDGSEFKLSSLKGNYVLLDYWGTWCGPCMGEMPKIKEYYHKYKDKNFLVYGVDNGDTDQKWRKSIEENEFDWNHIRSTKEQDLLIPFNVNSFPTKILIDPEGKIIYSSKNKDSKMNLYQTLDSLFAV